MTVTLEIKDDKLDLFWQIIAEHGLADTDVDLKSIEEAHIQDILLREQDPILSQARPWAEVREKYVGKGL
jgi:hypothetical protein